MLKSRTLITALAVIVIAVSAIIFLNIYGKTRLVPSERPERGLGYSPPGGVYRPGSGIKNSPHDLSAKSGYHIPSLYNPEGETSICIFCHIPDELEQAPKMADSSNWNHAPSAVVSFSPYNSGVDGPNNQGKRVSADVSRGPGPISRFCLGCHDGTVAVNRYGALSGNVHISDSSNVGRNGVLSNHHPIGFVYAAVINRNINPSPTLGTHPLEELLSNGKMECTTCHDVHNKSNSGEKLLWVSDRNSALCCSCHALC